MSSMPFDCLWSMMIIEFVVEFIFWIEIPMMMLIMMMKETYLGLAYEKATGLVVIIMMKEWRKYEKRKQKQNKMWTKIENVIEMEIKINEKKEKDNKYIYA